MAFFKSRQHFSLVLRIQSVHGLIVTPHSQHVQGVVHYELIVIEDTLGPAIAGHDSVHSVVLHGLLRLRGQLEVSLLGTELADVIVTIRMLAAVVYVILVYALHVTAVHAYAQCGIHLCGRGNKVAIDYKASFRLTSSRAETNSNRHMLTTELQLAPGQIPFIASAPVIARINCQSFNGL